MIGGAFGLVRGDAPYRPSNGTTWPKIWWFAQRRNDVDAQAISRLLARHIGATLELIKSDETGTTFAVTTAPVDREVEMDLAGAKFGAEERSGAC